MTITYPCESGTTDINMTKIDTGEYQAMWDIPDDALYGEYTVEVTALTGTTKSKFVTSFYILPWDAIQQIRRVSGIKSKKSISDDDMAEIFWDSYKEALTEVYPYHNMETPLCNPDTGEWINGTNTTFALRHSPIADHDGDGSITGWGEQSCVTDVQAWWKDEDGNCYRAKVTVNEPQCANVDITKLDGNPIPSSAQWLKVSYYSEWRTYNERLFRKAVCYLAAHRCILRFQELDKSTLADLHSNRETVLANYNRMRTEYYCTLNKIRKPVVGGGMQPGG